MNGDRLRFDEFEFDTRTLELWRSGEPVVLRPQPATVLLFLVQHAGELVTREQLRDHVWGTDVSVDFEHSLNSAIRQVRVALGERAGEPRLLQTFPRRGYRFAAAVESVGADSADGAEDASVPAAAVGTTPGAPEPARHRSVWGWVGAVAAVVVVAVAAWAWTAGGDAPPVPDRARTLAILPFTAASGGEQEVLFGEGLSQEVIGELGRLHSPALSVLAPESTLRLGDRPEPVAEARRLGADLVVRGSLRREDNAVRVTAQLLDANASRQLWADTFDGDLRETFRLQREIASTILAALIDELDLPAVPAATADSPANMAYLGGRARFVRGAGEDLVAAIGYFEEAVRLDPQLAPAWAYLARALMDAPVDPDRIEREVPEAIERALRLHPGSASAHVARARWRMRYQWDIAGALQDADTAVRLEPGGADAHAARAAVLSALGRHDEALVETRTALALDPLSPTLRADAAWYLYVARRWRESISEARLGIDLEEHLVRAWDVLLYSAIAAGDTAVAREAMLHRLVDIGAAGERLQQLQASSDADLSAIYWDALLQWLRSGAGDTAAINPLPASLIPGLIFSGDLDGAMAALAQAAERRGQARVMPYLRVAPYLEPLRSRPAFVQLQQQISWPPDTSRP